MTEPATPSTFIEAVRKADTRDGILFTFLFDQGVSLLMLTASYEKIADLLGVDAPTVTRWRVGVNLPQRAMCRSILEKLVVALM